MNMKEEEKAKAYIEAYLNGWHVGYEQGIVDTIKNLGNPRPWERSKVKEEKERKRAEVNALGYEI